MGLLGRERGQDKIMENQVAETHHHCSKQGPGAELSPPVPDVALTAAWPRYCHPGALCSQV